MSPAIRSLRWIWIVQGLLHWPAQKKVELKAWVGGVIYPEREIHTRRVNKKWNQNVNQLELVLITNGLGGIMLKVHAKKLDAVKVLCLEGQIITGETDLLRRAVQLTSGGGNIILDLSNVSVVDAHGLGVLLQLREQTIARGMRLELINVSKPLHRIFEITRLNTVFEISSGLELLAVAA